MGGWGTSLQPRYAEMRNSLGSEGTRCSSGPSMSATRKRSARVRGENIQPTGPWRAPRPSSPPAGRVVDT
eukprot:2450433-Pyramimonas_sp.AAC.1